jgi:hypothetical protein
VGDEGIPELLLGSHSDEVEIGGKAWEGLGSSRLERYVCGLLGVMRNLVVEDVGGRQTG